jgi:hypothetical protein
MTDKTTGDLDAAAALDGTELVHVVQGGNSRKATLAEVAGAASVVLADIDLSARDLRIGQNPLILTDADQWRDIVIDFYATHGTDSAINADLSSDGGTNYNTGASDYAVAGFLASSTGISTTALSFLAISPPTALGHGRCTISQAWNANARTQAVYISGGDVVGAARYFCSYSQTVYLADAVRIFSTNAHTGGRMTVVGYR